MAREKLSENITAWFTSSPRPAPPSVAETVQGSRRRKRGQGWEGHRPLWVALDELSELDEADRKKFGESASRPNK